MQRRFSWCFVLPLIIAVCRMAHAKDTKVDTDSKEGGVDTVIGIDLGTTYSCVGVFKKGKVEIIPNDQGNRITPSYVAFTLEGDRLLGDAAKNQLTSNPENTIFDVKRFIGRRWSEPTVQHDRKFYPFKIISKSEKPYVEVKVGNATKAYTPEEISGMVLGKMKEIAEAYLGKKVTNAVITVPAYFNDAQRSATKDAGIIAGLKVLRIINEPTAAAIAYGIDKKDGEKNILVFDLGGGTFDVSILTIDKGIFEVIATNGNTHLGGEDFDQRVMEYFIKMFKTRTNKDIQHDNRAVQKLRREVEKAKRALSGAHQVRLEIESFYNGEDFSESLTRAKFEELNQDLFLSTLEPLKFVLSDANLRTDQIDEIVLVGGSTRIPKIQALVTEFFNGKKPSQEINPDEAVAFGAAVQAGVLSGEADTGDVVLLDVIPLTLGVEIPGGIISSIIPRNTVIPTKKSADYTTSRDGETAVHVKVYEGERPMAKDNHLLAAFSLGGIIPAPAGVPQIQVTFEIDANGILKVTAEDRGSGSKKEVVISSDQNRLSPDDIERMINDAEKFSDVDKVERERQSTKTDLLKYVYQLKHQLTNEDGLGGKVTNAERTALTNAIQSVTSWANANPNATQEQMKAKRTEFDAILKPITDALYKRKAEEENKDEDDDDEDDQERDEL